jgi:hypothetical protein
MALHRSPNDSVGVNVEDEGEVEKLNPSSVANYVTSATQTFVFSNFVIVVRKLVREAWSRYRWGTVPIAAHDLSARPRKLPMVFCIQ